MRSIPTGEIRCPGCGLGSLTSSASEGIEVRCDSCSRSYPIDEGVVELLPEVSGERSPAQRLMESRAIIRIYESRLWRRSSYVALLLGVSFTREQHLIERAAELASAERVLDLACGPGIYTRYFARKVSAGSVVGLDLSLPMLRYASRRAHQEQVENVLWIHGTALDLPFPPEHFDVVNCCGALHLFPDVARALGEVGRVLKPTGRFTVAAFRRREGRAAAIRAAARRRLSGLDAFSTSDLESRLHAAGLQDVQIHHARRAWLIASARKTGEEAKVGA